MEGSFLLIKGTPFLKRKKWDVGRKLTACP
jgi:hypothetical protein